ncbi:serine/threonine-protein phosphatase 7 long form homolog [Vicia villosa]|uniref:serine/threonine-protein phosphatase 7 long form homolog n=1 Tax=Vicia villosa TaxID=3911 RepID=UPI00273BE81D|nr:serine/threonine-protein phosphatase 7 long form homolog [Vicia villosa]
MSDLLTLGETHRGTRANVAAYDDSKRFRLHTHLFDREPSEFIKPYLDRAGFGVVAKINFRSVDSKLVVAMLERWRPETHTFHLPTGECTIMLEDVSMLFGLRIDGRAVVGETKGPNYACLDALCIEPFDGPDRVKGSVKLTWIHDELDELEKIPQPTEEQNILHAKLYILSMIAVLFPDKSHNVLHSSWFKFVKDLNECGKYSWGSACLCYLYRELCKACHVDVKSVAGCSLLLAVWAYYRIPRLAPRSEIAPSYPYAVRFAQRDMEYFVSPNTYLDGYRFILDHMVVGDFLWRPYAKYPRCVQREARAWSATTYIICFHMVEMHHADRVRLQFGFTQDIPQPPRCLEDHHAITKKDVRDAAYTVLNIHENNE